ncbi:DsbA family protein [Aeromicrobium fastidiosum]|uniref:DsbA family oxidoreductase n=1 Tax=Aeromicrobium fastidiosum TaxID=52699 RepID=UPI002023337C|nr:DsbA family protein [Aeromicrobium fastidiosum]MCL8252083.1 DsbA family protein [Aeromicrobium fastidiosum]
MKVIVFADVTDPWAYIGSTRFERAAAMFSILTGEPIELTYRALLLEPDEPSDGRLLLEALDERLGGRDQVELVNAQVTAAARITGIDLNFDEAVQANSFDAWRLLTWADESGPGFQRDLLHQLWRAHFLEGADIGDPFTLATRAALVGLELETAEALLASTEYADEVRTQDEVGTSLEVAQLPYVAIEQRWTLVGIQSQNDYVQALHQIYTEWKAEQPSEE